MKVYIVMAHSFLDMETHSDFVICVFSTSEAAEQYIQTLPLTNGNEPRIMYDYDIVEEIVK